MGISYRRTWMMVDTMNRCWTEPLVSAQPGGGARSGAKVTPMGRLILETYRSLEANLLEAASTGVFSALTAELLPCPRPPNANDDLQSPPV
jgi:molybdate transport system regulatory protein